MPDAFTGRRLGLRRFAAAGMGLLLVLVGLAVVSGSWPPGDGVLPQGVLGAEATPAAAPARAPIAVEAPAPPRVSATPYADLPDASFPHGALAAPGPVPPSVLDGYRWPIPHPRITDHFGPSPWGSRMVGGQLFHDGLDLATFCGDRVTAAHDGVVLAAGRHYDDQIGWVGDLTAYEDRLTEKGLWVSLPIVVVTDDGNGYRSIYAHFGRIVVTVGETVRAGQLIGYEGATGRATGCHLHYGLFSPLEKATFETEPVAAAHMLLPTRVVARIDPLLVLPPW